MADTTGQVNLRAETVDAVVKGFALQEYKFKQALTISTSNSWKESYYQESATELSGGTGNAIRGVPRLANFPYGEPNWTKQSSYLEKYGFEGVVSYEDQKTDTIDVIARTLLRIGRAIAKSVDDQIWSALTTAANINSFVINNEIYAWDVATYASGANVLNDINRAKQLISENNYPAENAYLFISPYQYRFMLKWLADKGAQFPSLGASVATNGNVGTLGGLRVVVSNSVAVSGALVVVASEAATWKSAVPLTTKTIDDPGIKTTIRAWEIGVTQVTNPKAICWIKGIQQST